MKNLKFDRGNLKLASGGYSIDTYIELESEKKLNYEERLELIKEYFDFDEEDFYESMAEESEYTEQIGKVLVFFIDGEGSKFTKEEAQKLDELIG